MSQAGMDHSNMGHAEMAKPGTSSQSGMDHSAMGHGQPGTSSMQPGPMATMDHGAPGMQQHPASENGNPLVDMQTINPVPKLDDPGIGLRDNGRKVLTYEDLRSTDRKSTRLNSSH